MIQVMEPATEQVMAEVPRAGVEEVDAAVARAKAAFAAWRDVAPADRSRLIGRLADRLESELEDLATLEARNAGKPIGDARGEIGMVVETFRYYAAAPERLLGQDDPRRRRRRHDLPRAARRRRPDRALELPARHRLVEGGPGAGRRQHDRPEARRADAADRPRARAHRARGRDPGGRRQRRRRPRLRLRPAPRRAPRRRQDRLHRLDRGRAGDRRDAAGTIKRVTLELGGKSANVVFADADLERPPAAPGAVFGNAGQDCCARSRILVERSALDRFMEALEEQVEAITVGDPLSEDTQMGPLISAPTARRSRPSWTTTRRWRSGIGAGGRRVLVPADGAGAGLERRPRRPRGDLRAGGLRDPVRRRGRGGRDRQRHDLRPLGLGLDARRGARAARRARDRRRRDLDQLEHLGAVSRRPFGGFKQSGVGRELGPDALDAYTEVKNVYYATEEG